MTATPELSRPVNVERLPKGWTRLEVVADDGERRALAERFGIMGVESLVARIGLKPVSGSRMVQLEGRIEAEVSQACVVTLDPVSQHVDEAFSLTYAPPEATEHREDISFSYEEADPPEPIVDGVIDVGEAVAEHLALALDPFPRRADAEFTPVADAEDEARPNPFATLGRLKKKIDEA